MGPFPWLSCPENLERRTSMPIEDNKAFARRYMEELVQLYIHKNLTIIDELCVPDVVIHS
jgi:hypothetical protein